MERRIKLPDGKYIELNDQQVEALQLIRDWLQNKLIIPDNSKGSRLLFRLQGFAGTGKTTIIKEAINWFRDGPGRWERDVMVTAPTHKAKKEISRTTMLQGKTIQALIGLAPNTDVLHFDINNPEFALKNKPGIEFCSVVVIDEASMLNKDLFELLVSQAEQYKIRLLFMCDSAQLPPVKEELSPVITSKKIVFSYELTKVERQSGDNPLMFIYDDIRNDITSLKDKFKHHTHIIETEYPGIEGLPPTVIKTGIEFLSDLSKFGGRVVTGFASHKFVEDSNYCKMLCWTNDRVKFWNDNIRRTLILRRRAGVANEDLGDRVHDLVVMPNELLMGYSNYTGGITNSAEYRVTEIEYDNEILEFGQFINGDTSLGRENQVDISVYNVHLIDIDNDLISYDLKIVEPTTENYRNFLLAFNWYLSQGKFNKRWPMYFKWRENYMLISDIKDSGGKLIVKKDLDYAYALTVHKSQGSTYSEVFMDEVDIDRNPNHIERNKLKYVALSRPRNKATVFTGKTD